MFVFDSVNFDPPAPAARVTIQNPSTGQQVSDVLMLIDTGADASLLPRFSLEQIGIQILAASEYELVGFDGTRRSALSAEARMVMASKTFRGKFLTQDGSIGIIGRDILNLLIIRYDGPACRWSVEAR
jgi:predicted aspartyl protease